LRFVSDVFAETVITFAESIVDLIHGTGSIRKFYKVFRVLVREYGVREEVNVVDS
jgi:hypothetical protein